MFFKASANEEILLAVCSDCYLTHRELRAWPLREYVPRGRSRGVLVPRIERYHAPSTPTIGVFELGNLLEFIWQDAEGTALFASIGPQGYLFKQAIALRTVDWLSKKYNFVYRVTVDHERIKVRIMAAEIVVSISKTGETSVEVEGGSGGSCTNLTKALEEKLGKVTDQSFKPEYYNKPQDQRVQTRM